MKRFSLVRNESDPLAGVCVLRVLVLPAAEGGVSGMAECVDCGGVFTLHCPATHRGPCGDDCLAHHLHELDSWVRAHVAVSGRCPPVSAQSSVTAEG